MRLRHPALIAGFLLFAVLCTWSLAVAVKQPQVAAPYGDPADYNSAAIHLAESGIYSLDGVTPFFEREPGFSMFLAGVYVLFGAGNVVMALLSVAAVYFLSVVAFAVSLRPFVNRRTELFIFFGLLVLPQVYHSIFSFTREGVALALGLLFSACVLRAIRPGFWLEAVGAGLFLGLLIITNIPFLLVPLALPVLFWLLGGSWKQGLLISVVSLVIVGGWGARNFLHRGELCLTGCHRSVLQWYVRAEQAETLRGREPFDCLWSEYITRDWTGRDKNCSFNAVWHYKWTKGYVPGPEDSILERESQKRILELWPHYLWMSVFEVLEIHVPYVNGWGRTYNFLTVFMTVILYLGVLLWLLSRRWSRVLLLPLFLIFYVVGLFALTDATPRYLVPVSFCYVWFAAMGYDWLLSRLPSKR